MNEDIRKEIRHSLTQLLSRREHSYRECIQKLQQKGFAFDDFADLLDKFKEADLQSNVRFAEMHIRSGIGKGQGLTRIKETLRQNNVADSDINAAMKDIEVDWFELACIVRVKKFGSDRPVALKDKARQQRFLQYRGFSFEQIEHALTSTDDP